MSDKDDFLMTDISCTRLIKHCLTCKSSKKYDHLGLTDGENRSNNSAHLKDTIFDQPYGFNGCKYLGDRPKFLGGIRFCEDTRFPVCHAKGILPDGILVIDQGKCHTW